MQRMIREFEDVLNEYGENQIKGITSAIDFIVGKYSKFETNLICPYISKRIGIAEWIVRGDIMQRYKQMEIAIYPI